LAVSEMPRGFAALAALWRDASRRRKLASLAIALAIEGLILLLLLTLGANLVGEKDAKEAITTFKAQDVSSAPEPEPEQAAEASAADTPQTDQPVPQSPIRPSPLVLNPQPAPQPPPAPAPPEPQTSPSPQPSARPKIGARIRPNAGGFGPADTGNPRTAGDSEQVGTMANGEPLYRARWYREPTEQELLGYLSTANGPGYALIACRVVSGYYVEDCQFLSEGPQGSQIGRAVMAAAWQFRVRPARVDGKEQFGSWVQIRIDYTVSRRERR
jgi:periplasmic protein TonB